MLVLTAIYLIGVEVSSMYVRGFAYLYSVTKIANIVTPFLILWNVFSDNLEDVFFWEIQTWAALAIWFRFLLFLRTV